MEQKRGARVVRQTQIDKSLNIAWDIILTCYNIYNNKRIHLIYSFFG